MWAVVNRTVENDASSMEAPAELAWRGIELCRRDHWQEGLCRLGEAAEAAERNEELPGLFYAYLGYGIARFQGHVEEGVRLCRRAVELEFYQPESYYYLARTYLLSNDRRAAIDAIERGFQVDAGNGDLQGLKAELGQRRPPVIPALPRRHFLNRWLGRLRHRLAGPRRAAG